MKQWLLDAQDIRPANHEDRVALVCNKCNDSYYESRLSGITNQIISWQIIRHLEKVHNEVFARQHLDSIYKQVKSHMKWYRNYRREQYEKARVKKMQPNLKYFDKDFP